MSYCPGCLKENQDTYCSACLKKLFNGKKVSHQLSFTRPEFDRRRLGNSGRLSISGIQVKYLLRLEGNQLVLTETNGEYILKPVPRASYENMEALPANENLTMQIASQVFNINTAANALVFFAGGEPAYITRRFDVPETGKKIPQEDFAQLLERTEETGGKNYKYNGSYEEIASAMNRFVGAYKVEVEKFLRLVIFNYRFCNGDAHLKNFSLYRHDQYGAYLLTPAYDLVNTSLYAPGESDTALELFKDGFMTEAYHAGSKYTYDDFYEFGTRIGIIKPRLENIIKQMSGSSNQVSAMVERSSLTDGLKKLYMESVGERTSRLLYSYTGKI